MFCLPVTSASRKLRNSQGRRSLAGGDPGAAVVDDDDDGDGEAAGVARTADAVVADEAASG